MGGGERGPTTTRGRARATGAPDRPLPRPAYQGAPNPAADRHTGSQHPRCCSESQKRAVSAACRPRRGQEGPVAELGPETQTELDPETQTATAEQTDIPRPQKPPPPRRPAAGPKEESVLSLDWARQGPQPQDLLPRALQTRSHHRIRHPSPHPSLWAAETPCLTPWQQQPGHGDLPSTIRRPRPRGATRSETLAGPCPGTSQLQGGLGGGHGSQPDGPSATRCPLPRQSRGLAQGPGTAGQAAHLDMICSPSPGAQLGQGRPRGVLRWSGQQEKASTAPTPTPAMQRGPCPHAQREAEWGAAQRWEGGREGHPPGKQQEGGPSAWLI